MNRFLCDLGDDLDELLNAPVVQDGERKAPPAHYQPPTYDEPCKKCGGSGRFRSWNGRDCGPCFTCKGKGKKTFATAPEKRAQARASAAAKPVRNWEAFVEAHPAVAEWILSAPDFAFATSMKEAVERFGELTSNQLAACHRCIQGRAKAQAARAERVAQQQAAAPEVNIARIEEAFASARRNGIKRPKLKLGSFTFKPAPATGKWAGSIYVTQGQDYLGRVTGGQLFTTRDCGDERRTQIVEVCADPAQAAKAYGFRTGNCSCCGRELTKKESIDLGIGPICASKYGW